MTTTAAKTAYSDVSFRRIAGTSSARRLSRRRNLALDYLLLLARWAEKWTLMPSSAKVLSAGRSVRWRLEASFITADAASFPPEVHMRTKMFMPLLPFFTSLISCTALHVKSRRCSKLQLDCTERFLLGCIMSRHRWPCTREYGSLQLHHATPSRATCLVHGNRGRQPVRKVLDDSGDKLYDV